MTGESVRAIITNPEVMAVTFIAGIGLGLLLEGVTVAFTQSQFMPVVFVGVAAIVCMALVYWIEKRLKSPFSVVFQGSSVHLLEIEIPREITRTDGVKVARPSAGLGRV